MAANPLTDPNWAAETTDTVVRVVGQVREKTTTPVIYAARGLVYGVLAAFLAVFAIGLLLVGIQRAIQALWAIGFDTPQAVYLSYFTLGGILTVVGMFLFWKRNRAAS